MKKPWEILGWHFSPMEELELEKIKRDAVKFMEKLCRPIINREKRSNDTDELPIEMASSDAIFHFSLNPALLKLGRNEGILHVSRKEGGKSRPFIYKTQELQEWRRIIDERRMNRYLNGE